MDSALFWSQVTTPGTPSRPAPSPRACRLRMPAKNPASERTPNPEFDLERVGRREKIRLNTAIEQVVRRLLDHGL